MAVDPSAEPLLLDTARRDSVAAVARKRQQVEAARSSRDQQRADYCRRRAQRSLRARPDGNGFVDVYGKFTVDDWAPVGAVLDSLRKKIFTTARKEGRRESYDAYLADALVAMAKSAPGTSSGVNATINVVVDHSAIERGHVEAGERCEVPGVGPISVDTARALAQDCWLNVLVRKGVDITTVAGESRYVPKAVRRALDIAEPKCSVRGCEMTVGLELDHRVGRRENGKSKYDNLALLCAHHHYLKTHKGFRLVGRTGDYVLVPPDPPPDSHQDDELPPRRRRPNAGALF